jgi:hypothetical protein
MNVSPLRCWKWLRKHFWVLLRSGSVGCAGHVMTSPVFDRARERFKFWFGVLTAVTTKSTTVFWVLTRCSSERSRRFGRNILPRLQGRRVSQARNQQKPGISYCVPPKRQVVSELQGGTPQKPCSSDFLVSKAPFPLMLVLFHFFASHLSEPLMSRVAVWKQLHWIRWFAKTRHRSGAPQTLEGIWSWVPDGARHQDGLIDWPSVATWLWLWRSQRHWECEYSSPPRTRTSVCEVPLPIPVRIRRLHQNVTGSFISLWIS